MREGKRSRPGGRHDRSDECYRRDRWCLAARREVLHMRRLHMRRATGYKDERKMRLGGKTRSAIHDGAPQDGRSGGPGCQVSVREEERGKEREKEGETRERGAPHREGSLAVPRPGGREEKGDTKKRWHAAACWLCRDGFLHLGITGLFIGTCKSRRIIFSG